MTFKEFMDKAVAEYKLTDKEISDVCDYYLFIKMKKSGLFEQLNQLRVTLKNVFK